MHIQNQNTSRQAKARALMRQLRHVETDAEHHRLLAQLGRLMHGEQHPAKRVRAFCVPQRKETVH